jgi:hypothetical protein
MIAGRVENSVESPVELSDARYTLVIQKEEPARAQLVAHGVKIRNVSGRAIRRLMLRFVIHHESLNPDKCRSSVISVVAVDTLAATEMRDFTDYNIRVGWFGSTDGRSLTVLASGAQFEDGQYWAAPRKELCPLSRECLSQSASYLMARRCTVTDDSYSLTLEVGDPKIVAYRLGVVSDTADSFAVRTGEWIELTEVQRARGAKVVDSGNSLSPEMIFPRETFVSILEGGKQITTRGGVSIFVAELRFADGRVWRQDTSRAALFWDN